MKLKNIFWIFVAFLTMFATTSCYDDEGNLISNKLGDEIYGTWFAQYDAQGTIDDHAYESVVETYTFTPKMGIWNRFFIDEDGVPVADLGGGSGGLGEFEFYADRNGVIGLRLIRAKDSKDIALYQPLARMILYENNLIKAEGLDGKTHGFVKADQMWEEIFLIWHDQLEGGSGDTDAVYYIERGWNGHEVTRTVRQLEEYKTLSGNLGANDMTLSNNGWYVVSDKNVKRKLITIPSGTSASLIICDGAKIRATFLVKGKLTIYGQTNDKGVIDAVPIDANEENFWRKYYSPIGGTYKEDMGSLIVHGGTINAIVDNHTYTCAGIGGGNRSENSGYDADGGNVTIYGGIITAKGGDECAGIGGAEDGDGGTVTIYGGKVTARGGKYGAGIGGGQKGNGATVVINGGTVNSYGGVDAAGIGSGEETTLRFGVHGGSLTVNGGYVFADGTDWGAGIGGGEDADGAKVVINGGTVIAWAGADAGKKNGSAIGSENGDGCLGSLHIAEGLKVSAGKSPSSLSSFSAPERVPACHWRPYARIEPCTRHQYVKGVCKWCGHHQ